MKYLVGILLCCFSLFSCKTNLKSEKNKVDFTVTVNHEFTIALKSNPTTGYSWKWINPQNSSKIEKTGEKYVPSTPKNLIGEGGITTFTFRGIRKGLATLEMVYIRPWEQGAQPQIRMTYSIEVR